MLHSVPALSFIVEVEMISLSARKAFSVRVRHWSNVKLLVCSGDIEDICPVSNLSMPHSEHHRGCVSQLLAPRRPLPLPRPPIKRLLSSPELDSAQPHTASSDMNRVVHYRRWSGTIPDLWQRDQYACD